MGQISWITVVGLKFCREDFVILSSKPRSVVGSLPYWSSRIRPGMMFGLEVEEVREPRFGLQLKPILPRIYTDEAQPLTVLSACELALEEPLTCFVPTKHQEEGVRLLLAGDLSGLSTLVGKDLAEKLSRGWDRFQRINDFIPVLALRGVGGSLIGTILSMYSIESILQNPWRLVLDQVLSIEQVEGIATHLGIQITDLTRAEIAVVQALQGVEARGGTGCPVSEMVPVVQGINPQWDLPSVVGKIKDLAQQGLVHIERVGSLGPIIYLPHTGRREAEIAKLVIARLESAKMREDSEEAKFLKALTGAETLEDALDRHVAQFTHLSPDQRRAVKGAVRSGVFLLTGLPGTGKTTTLRTLIAMFQVLGRRIKATAPTGIAARKIQEVSQVEASTIHSAFGYMPNEDLGSFGSYFGQDGGRKILGETDQDWRHDEQNPLDTDVLIMDEGSMIDQSLFHRSLIATSPNCQIIVVGDPAQIPSVGPGQVLSDLLQIPQIPSCSLTAVFRQALGSPILDVAFGVHFGKVPTLRVATSLDDAILPSRGEDFVLVEAFSDLDAQRKAVELGSRIYEDPTTYGNAQLLSPRHGGEVGVKRLNEILRERLNPMGPEVKFHSFSIREGDRVMMTRNNVQGNYYNGDLGSIRQVNASTRMVDPLKNTETNTTGMCVTLMGPPQREVFVPNRTAGSTLRLAYAMTFHKSQGQEYDTVVILLMPSFGNQVSKRLLYTAITRAKRRCVVIGTRYAFEASAARPDQDVRRTFLADRIKFSVAQ